MRAWLRIGALFCLQFAGVAQPAQTQPLPGHVPAAVAHLTAAGRLEGSRELKLAIGLPLRDKAGLTNLLQEIYDPASPDYHHFLTPAQFAERFGPTEEDYQAVTAFATAHGLKVTATHPNRTLLDVTGAVSDIEKALHVTMRTYAHPRENREFYAPDVEPSLDLAAPVLNIGGLDNYLLPHPMNLRKKPADGVAALVPASGSGPAGAYLGHDFRAAYVPGLALTGAGQSVGLVEFDGYYLSDITNYAGMAGLAAVPLKTVLLDGFNGLPGGGNVEVALDIDMAVSMAPGLSSVIVYEGEVPDDVLNRMATDDLANQLSASWTYSTDSETEQIFQQFAAQGQSFFNASGDGDAYVGEVAPPSDDPNITSVGGTTLATSGPGGGWVSETVWNWDVEYGSEYDGEGTGGGISTTYAIPAWQTNLSMATNQGSTVFRNVPDVAMVADNVFVVADDGASGAVGGTSCATPLWAAFTALVNEQALAHGRPLLGFINPAVYALGQSANYSNGFHDIATGNNTWSESPANFYATAGYDLCTGWGTPAGSNLVNLLAPLDSLLISSLGGFSASGAVGGPLTPASQSYVLTNVGNAALNWAAGATVPWLKVSPSGGALTPGGAAAAVVASFNAAASNLFLGSYGATLWFTNLTDGDIQNRAVSLSIIKPPAITAQPASLALIGGTTAAFTASAAGGVPLACQWQFNGTNLTDGGRISGSQTTLAGAGNLYGSLTTTLTISNMAASDGGSYTLVASNAAGVAVSLNAVLTVTPSGPVIVQQPASQTTLVGATVQFAVAADGSAPFTYQWQFNQANLTDGGVIAGSDTPTLTLNGVSSANIGTYTVVVSNSLSTATSTGAVLTVQVAQPVAGLVQNGGFETGSFSSWNESGNFGDCSVSSSSPAVYSGTYGALLGSVGSLGYLSQSLPTVPAQLYLLSLELDSPDGISPSEFLVMWNGTTLFDQTNLGAISWTNLQFYVMATGANTLLEFGFRDDGSFLGLDNIQAAPLVSANGPPIIATQPANQVGLQGGAASFSVLAAGAMPLFYQWQFDGANLAQATNATLTLTNLTNSQAGSYSVVVSNSLNWTTSSNALLTVLTGSAALVTFDELPGASAAVPTGYLNLAWSNFYYMNAVAFGQPSGYVAGMVSPDNVAYNGYGTPAALSASGPFDLLSAYLTAAWYDNLRVEVQGYTGPVLSYDNTYTLSATAPTLITFNYLGVTAVQFICSGGTQHAGYGDSGQEFVLDNMTVVPPAPTPMSVLYSFNGFDGGFPSAGLALGPDGNFYGTTAYGGTYDDGMVFRLTTNGALTTLLSFNNSNGSHPYAALILGKDGNFYGTTSEGGTGGSGTVFRMTTNGALTTLASFNYSLTGGYPYAALVQGADGNFYGTTTEGGTYSDGTVFRMAANGALNALLSFNGTNGSSPYAALVQGTDSYFYGTTSEGGGTNGYAYGTVFRMAAYGGLTTLHVFDYNDGGNPSAGLVQGADGNFYGATSYGGAGSYGTVFRITAAGALTTLYSFSYTDGYYPHSTLILGADGNFYGTTEYGGAYFNGATAVVGSGTVFRMTTNGALTTLLSLAGADGSSPQGSLAQGADGNFYGTTTYGGSGFNGSSLSGNGTVFRVGAAPAMTAPVIAAQPVSQIVPAGGTAGFSVSAVGAAPLNYFWLRNGSPISGATQSGYTNNNFQLSDSGSLFKCVISNSYGMVTTATASLTVFGGSGPVYSFQGPDGGNSLSELIQGADGNFYGTTEYGGTNGEGTLFRVTTNGALSTLASFEDSLSGSYPQAGLVQGADGSFYGTTGNGGADGYGTVFKMTPNGTLTNLASFDFFDGYSPYGALVQGADGNLYGTTAEGGAGYDGTIFRVTTNGLLTTLFSFAYTNGSYPRAPLVQGADGNLYGTTAEGGAGYDGTVFRITTNGALTTLVSFRSTNGSYPYSALIQGADGNFYGTTSEGGAYYDGTVFRMTTNGALTTLASFNYSLNGSSPAAGLVQGVDGNFYGTTEYGGTNGLGTIFRMKTNGTLSNLFSFTGTNGLYPQAALLQDGYGNFFTTATYGGPGYNGSPASGNGTVFRLAGVITEPPLISTQPVGRVVAAGGSVTFNVTASGVPPPSYTWLRNTVPIAGATSNSYTAGNVQLADSGSQFSCLVSNAYGTALSSSAVLTVFSSALTNILLFYDDSAPSVFATALANMNVPFQLFPPAQFSSFSAAAAAAKPAASLLIVDSAVGTFDFSNVAAFADAGGRALLSGSGAPALAAAFQAVAITNYTAPMPVYNWSASPLFNGVAAPLAFTTLGAMNGLLLQPSGSGSAAAGYVSSPAANQAAIIIGNSTKTILNGFPLGWITPASNAVQLAANEIQLMLGSGTNMPPTLAALSASQTVLAGGSVSFSVTVSGAGPFNYQWQLNGTNLPDGVITTLAGNGTAGYSQDGVAASGSELYYPSGVAVDAFGNLFIADYYNNRIREVDTNGIISTVAGVGIQGSSGDGGPATNATFHSPFSVALDASGNLFVADHFNGRIREVGTNGTISTVAGNGTKGFSGDGGAATSAELNNPYGVFVDPSGNLFIADSANNRVREVGTNGVITTVAGNGKAGYAGDGAAATNAELSGPYGVAVDAAGNLFIADSANNRVREVRTNGIITTVAGNGTKGYLGDGGAATAAELNDPFGVTVDSSGNLFIADTYNECIRKVGINGIITTVAGNGTQGYSGDGGAPTNAELHYPSDVAVDASGNLFIADYFNQCVRGVIFPGPKLILNDVSAANAGVYDVVVSSPYGSVSGDYVTLTIGLPPLNALLIGGQGVQMQFQGNPGSSYVLVSAVSLTPPINWIPVYTNTADVNGNWSVTVTNFLSNTAQYYRIAPAGQ